MHHKSAVPLSKVLSRKLSADMMREERQCADQSACSTCSQEQTEYTPGISLISAVTGRESKEQRRPEGGGKGAKQQTGTQISTCE